MVFNQKEQNLFESFIFNEPFNINDINRIDSLILSLPFQKGFADFKDFEGRKSMVKWIPYTPPFYGLYDILKNYIVTANYKCWNFNINHSNDDIQYTEYYSNNEGKYDWHTDNGGTHSRKLSIVIQLSDPSEYEGGELQIKDYNINNSINKIPKQKGLITVFPSYLLHRVTPVTKGTRKSLVWWVGGCPFN